MSELKNYRSFRVIEEKSAPHNAWITPKNANESRQDAEKIIFTAIHLLKSLQEHIKGQFDQVNICVTGQMHGIVLWNAESLVQGTHISLTKFVKHGRCGDVASI